MNPTTLYYIYDPMCSWCWGFSQTWENLRKSLAKSLTKPISVHYLLGGLATDNNQPMPVKTRIYIQENWQNIQKQIPGVVFNYDFWNKCVPMRSTYPACRAVIAAKNQDYKLELPMIKLIQQAYYLHAQNPSKNTTLIALANTLELNIKQFVKDLNAQKTQQQLITDIALATELGVNSFPSLVLQTNDITREIAIDYNNPQFMLNQIMSLLVKE